MSDSSDLGPGIGDEGGELQASVDRHPSRPRKRTPVGQIHEHFSDAWYRYINTPEGRYHRMAVLFDSVAAFQTRVKHDLIDRDKRDVSDICASFDVYLRELGARVVDLKPDQSVWKAWWSLRSKYLAQVTATPGVLRAEVQRHDLDYWRERLVPVDDPDTEA